MIILCYINDQRKSKNERGEKVKKAKKITIKGSGNHPPKNHNILMIMKAFGEVLAGAMQNVTLVVVVAGVMMVVVIVVVVMNVVVVRAMVRKSNDARR